MEEYVIINWILVWFSAIILPIIVDITDISSIINRLEFINLNISKGASFCHVSIKNRILHVICLVILGSQKWRGAPPNFKIRDIIIVSVIILLLNIEYQDKLILYIITDEIIRILDLILWIIKYFIEASASWVLPLIFIRGKNPIKFNSNPIHIVSQCEEDNEKIVPIIMIIINKKLDGKNLLFIKGRTIRVAQNKVSSFILSLITFRYIGKQGCI